MGKRKASGVKHGIKKPSIGKQTDKNMREKKRIVDLMPTVSQIMRKKTRRRKSEVTIGNQPKLDLTKATIGSIENKSPEVNGAKSLL